MQRNETIKNLFPGYYRKHDQDMETLADLTKRAKGDERSINEFARVCGVSPSTISRLINKKNTTPNKDSLIKAIADNAVPESGVTLDMLLQAHGLEKISVYEGKGISVRLKKKKILFILRMKLDLERILLSKQNY